jgi:hypothetical protein
MPASFDPERILRTLEGHQVRYVLIGGLAATLHGSPLVTTDVDVTPERARDNLERLSAALKELYARIRTDAVEGGLVFDDGGESLGASNVWNLTTAAGDLDITFSPAGTHGYSDLRKGARPVVVAEGLTIQVASLEDVIRERSLPTLRRLLEAEEDEARR